MKLKLSILPLLALLLVGCATTTIKPQDILAIACAPSDSYQIERCAEAVGDVYETYQKRAKELAIDWATPAQLKKGIQVVDHELTPLVRTLLQTANAYIALKAASSPAAAVKRADLDKQLTDVLPKVQHLPTLE